VLGANEVAVSPETRSFSFKTVSALFPNLNSENLTAADVKTLIPDPELGLDLNDYNLLGDTGKTRAANLFVKYRTVFEKFTNAAQVQTVLDKAAGMVLLDVETDKAKLDGWIRKYGESSGIDPDYLSDYAAESTSDAVRDKICSILISLDLSDAQNNEENTAAKINGGFTEASVMGFVAVTAADSGTTWGILKNMLTVKYAGKFNLLFMPANVSEAEVYRAMLGKDYNSIKEVEDDYAAIINNSAKIPVNPNRPSGSGISVGGGGGGTSYIKAPPPELPEIPEQPEEIENKDIFTDLGSVPWAKESVNSLAETGIISQASEFRPNDSITREEFTKLVVAAFGLYDENANVGFEDVSASDWSYSYIASAKNSGLINGTSETTFSPKENITRQDMAVIIFKAIKQDFSAYAAFDDQSEISDYAAGAVLTMRAKGIITGRDGNLFYPQTPSTRAEAAVIIHRTINN
jgi:hypothetical protein